MKRILILLIALAVVGGFAFAAGEQEGGDADGVGYRIALSNDYAGNSWRQTMIKDWQRAAEIAIEAGIVSEAPVFTTNESSAAEQAAQIQNLILEGYDAIVLNAASPTALNGAVRQALDAGIVVVSFDNAITEERAWRLITDFEYMGAAQIEYVADRFSSADILEIRGLAGTYVNDAIHEGIVEAMKNYPNLEIVGEVYGNWTQSVAQREVAGILPSLGEIDAVVTQGGDGYGTVKAFEAAGREVPLVIMGNRYDEMSLWKEMKEESDYETMSISIAPGVVTIALWTAVEVLDGTDVPKEMLLPPLTVTAETLDYHLSATEPGGVATINYPQQWVQQLIENWKAGDPPPPDPLPEM
jgi:ribose transport system substrate-binding protein